MAKTALRTLPRQLKIAVLHQAGPVPALDGTVKPPKPGGYRDSGSDIAYNLLEAVSTADTSRFAPLRGSQISVATPVDRPDPKDDTQWTFPDTKEGILAAIKERGANCLWSNTTLHSAHALVDLQSKLTSIWHIGQNPFDTEDFENKAKLNKTMAENSQLQGTFPKSWLIHADDLSPVKEIPLPAVVKPVRGRGSHGVRVAHKREQFEQFVKESLESDTSVLVEQFCKGEEITVTVLPAGEYKNVGNKSGYWATPIVTRFNHVDDIAPYNGVVAVTANSRVVSAEEAAKDEAYANVARQCEAVAELMQPLAAIRIDCRRIEDGGPFKLFDINMKPNATGPGRPGREKQDSLTLMSVKALGWDYLDLLLAQASLAQPCADSLGRRRA